MGQIGRSLVGLGVALVVIGVVLMVANRLGLGRLPGDFVVRKKGVTFYFPLATSVLVSVALSLLAYVVQRFRR